MTSSTVLPSFDILKKVIVADSPASMWNEVLPYEKGQL